MQLTPPFPHFYFCPLGPNTIPTGAPGEAEGLHGSAQNQTEVRRSRSVGAREMEKRQTTGVFL